MQAIVTKYLGPTDHRGSRVKAKCEAGTLTVSWDHALDADDNHYVAAKMLAERLGWVGPNYGRLVGGGMPDNRGNCYVFVRGQRKSYIDDNGKERCDHCGATLTLCHCGGSRD